jgi:Xaa-Pro aminopeptidase
MRRHDVEACLLFNEPNIRYATGASAMPVWSNTTFVRCALVPAEGLPILFEHPNSMHLFGGIDAHVRPMHAWEFTDDVGSHSEIFAREAVAAMRELGVTDDRLAIDRLGTPGFLAFQAAGISILDSGHITMEAREVKTPEEIEVLAVGGEVVMEMLRSFEAAIRPRGHRTRLARGPCRHAACRRRRAPGHEHGLLRPEHEPLACRDNRPGSRAWRPPLRPHRRRVPGGAIFSASRGRSCAAIPPPHERNARHIEHHTTGWRR